VILRGRTAPVRIIRFLSMCPVWRDPRQLQKPLATREDLFLPPRNWDAHPISGDKGISRQLFLIPVKVPNFRVADDSLRAISRMLLGPAPLSRNLSPGSPSFGETFYVRVRRPPGAPPCSCPCRRSTPTPPRSHSSDNRQPRGIPSDASRSAGMGGVLRRWRAVGGVLLRHHHHQPARSISAFGTNSSVFDFPT